MKNRKLLEIILAILGAFCLWLYVVTVVTPDDDLIITDIPITFDGENTLRSEHNLLVTNRSARTVTVTFHGSRLLLKQLAEDAGSITAVLDVSAFTSERDYSASVEIIPPTFLQSDQIQVVDYSPKSVQFTVEAMASRNIPVKGVFDGQIAPGYTSGAMTFSQDTIRITGPAALVDQVSYAQVIMGRDGDKALNRTTTRDLAVTLISVDGMPIEEADISLSTTSVQATLPVYLEKQLQLTLDIIYDASTNAENVTVTLDTQSATFLGEPDIIRDMKELSLGSLDLSALVTKDETSLTLPIPVPDGFILRSSEKTVKVTVRIKDLELQEVKRSTEYLTISKQAEGLNATVLDETVDLILRGDPEILSGMDMLQIELLVDLSKYKDAGIFTVPVTVKTNHPAVAALGSYTVKVNLSK